MQRLLKTMSFLGSLFPSVLFPTIPGSPKVWLSLPEQLPRRQESVTSGMEVLKSELCSNSFLTASLLCDLGQLAYPLCAPVNGDDELNLRGLLQGSQEMLVLEKCDCAHCSLRTWLEKKKTDEVGGGEWNLWEPQLKAFVSNRGDLLIPLAEVI